MTKVAISSHFHRQCKCGEDVESFSLENDKVFFVPRVLECAVMNFKNSESFPNFVARKKKEGKTFHCDGKVEWNGKINRFSVVS